MLAAGLKRPSPTLPLALPLDAATAGALDRTLRAHGYAIVRLPPDEHRAIAACEEVRVVRTASEAVESPASAAAGCAA